MKQIPSGVAIRTDDGTIEWGPAEAAYGPGIYVTIKLDAKSPAPKLGDRMVGLAPLPPREG